MSWAQIARTATAPRNDGFIIEGASTMNRGTKEENGIHDGAAESLEGKFVHLTTENRVRY